MLLKCAYFKQSWLLSKHLTILINYRVWDYPIKEQYTSIYKVFKSIYFIYIWYLVIPLIIDDGGNYKDCDGSNIQSGHSWREMQLQLQEQKFPKVFSSSCIR